MGIYWAPGATQILRFEMVPTPARIGVTLRLSVNQRPETTAGVTVTTPGGSFPLTYCCQSGPTLSEYRATLADYTPGGTYSLRTVTSAGTAATTLTAPGGITQAADGSQTSWAIEGNNDYVIVYQNFSPFASVYVVSPANSPQNIPASAYATPGAYRLETGCTESDTTVTGATVDSRLNASDLRVILFNR
jgi:hypothetical protein